MGKDTSYVGVRGRRITTEKLVRWTRELNNYIQARCRKLIFHASSIIAPFLGLKSSWLNPDPQSGISIRNHFCPRSPSPLFSHLSQQRGASPELSGQGDSIHSFLITLSRYVSEPPISTIEGDIQTLINGLKAILSCMPRNLRLGRHLNKAWEGQWHPDADGNIEDILCLLETNRNAKANERMNGTFQLIICHW